MKRESVVYTPVSLGSDTDDEETLVNEEIYKQGEFNKNWIKKIFIVNFLAKERKHTRISCKETQLNI